MAMIPTNAGVPSLRPYGHVGMRVRRLTATVFAIIVTGAGVLYSQNEDGYLGNFSDAQRIARPPKTNSQFVFTRLIYNGRIPAYYKNWYTDYPKGDRQLIEGLKRLTDLDIADQGRVVAINDPALFEYPFVYSSEVGQ